MNQKNKETVVPRWCRGRNCLHFLCFLSLMTCLWLCCCQNCPKNSFWTKNSSLGVMRYVTGYKTFFVFVGIMSDDRNWGSHLENRIYFIWPSGETNHVITWIFDTKYRSLVGKQSATERLTTSQRSSIKRAPSPRFQTTGQFRYSAFLESSWKTRFVLAIYKIVAS